MKKREPPNAVGGNANQHSHYVELCGGFSKKAKTELPYDLAIPLLGIYLEKMKTLMKKETHTPMFTATLFAKAKTWKQSKSPLTDEWFKKMSIPLYIYIYICNGIVLSYKKNERLPFAVTWMDLESITLSEIHQKKTNIVRYHL